MQFYEKWALYCFGWLRIASMKTRFEVESGTYTAPSSPSTPAPPTFILDGESVVLCPNATDDPVDPIPTVAPGKY